MRAREVAMGKDEQAIGSEDGGSGKGQPAGVEGGDAAPAKNETRAGTPKDGDAEKRLNPSAPGETGTTPGTNGK
jgi:hypothetical protein